MNKNMFWIAWVVCILLCSPFCLVVYANDNIDKAKHELAEVTRYRMNSNLDQAISQRSIAYSLIAIAELLENKED